MSSEIVLFESHDNKVSLEVTVDERENTVWLSKDQMAELFSRDRSVITRHISNAYKEGEIDKEATCAKFAQVQTEGSRQVERQVEYYNLDVVISVGYRVKSQRGVEFRRWATGVLREYVLRGHAENKRRLEQLGQIVQVMKRLPQPLDAADALDVVGAYAKALALFDDYDCGRIEKPEGDPSVYVLDYAECRRFIDGMPFAQASSLFGVEKDEGFKSSIAAIYQGFGGQDLYPSIQEKAANLLYFVVKNHSFLDGNKRIGAALFLYFLERNHALLRDGAPIVSNGMLVALTLMVAESNPEEKDAMVALVMTLLDMGARELGL